MKKIYNIYSPLFIFSFFQSDYKISIEGTIDLGLPPYIERSIKEAEANGASAIILKLIHLEDELMPLRRLKMPY